MPAFLLGRSEIILFRELADFCEDAHSADYAVSQHILTSGCFDSTLQAPIQSPPEHPNALGHYFVAECSHKKTALVRFSR